MRGPIWGVVYYSGHGVEGHGANYLIPAFGAVALEQVSAAVEPARKLRLVVLDACRDNPFLNRMRLALATRKVVRGLSRIEPEGGTLVVYSARDGHLPPTTGGRPQSVYDCIPEAESTPGIELNKLFRQVRDDVLEATSGAGHCQDARTPTLS